MSKTGLMVATATACFLIAAPSVAQQRADTPARADTQVTIGGDEIVVTARSMARSTANVLTSVDVLSGDVAQRQNVDNAWELFARLPGLKLAAEPRYNNVYHFHGLERLDVTW